MKPLICFCLDLLRRVSAFYFSAREQKLTEDLERSPAFDPERREIIKNEIAAQYISWLAARLRSFPYWGKGHLEYAVAALGNGNTAGCYAAANAALLLNLSPADKSRAKGLLAKTYLQSGEAERAARLLEELRAGGAGSPEVYEDLAAAYMAAGDRGKALEAISLIEKSVLSPQGHMLLEYLRGGGGKES